MSTAAPPRARRLQTVLRSREQVSPLELFFDLVFVLALTQCTAVMADEPTGRGLAKGLLILGVLWWSWVGYTWLTSVVDPEEGWTRFAIFAAMAAMLVAALAIPGAFDDSALTFALAYAVVRYAQVALLLLAGRDDPALTRSTRGLAVSTTLGVSLVVGATFADAELQGALWLLAIVLDVGGPFVFGVGGWRLAPAHFAERHGLILIIALGESIVAIGIGAEDLDVDALEIVAALVGIGIVCLLWWAYFDVYALVAERSFREATGVRQVLIARDAYALLHLPMIAGVVLFALGVKKVLEHADDPLEAMPAVALCGGLALYALAHVGFRLRNTGTLARPRVVAAVACAAVVPVALSAPALVALALLAAVWTALIAYETLRFRSFRAQIRAERAAAH